MRKVKLDLKIIVPSWNFCNEDKFTANGMESKTKCRFCVSTKKGSYCTLYDEMLASDGTFTHKTAGCIRATAGFGVEVDDTLVAVDPKLIVRETVKTYNKTLSDLLKSGYPRNIAEQVAMEYVIGG